MSIITMGTLSALVTILRKFSSSMLSPNPTAAMSAKSRAILGLVKKRYPSRKIASAVTAIAKNGAGWSAWLMKCLITSPVVWGVCARRNSIIG